MTIVLDAGAFVAIERGNRDVVALLKRELLEGRVPLTHGGIVAQVWRGGTRQQPAIARLLPAVEVAAVDEELRRRVGVLLGRSRRTDAIEATTATSMGTAPGPVGCRHLIEIAGRALRFGS